MDTAASVFDQSLPDWELVFIDDGSSDATAERLTALARNDARIKLLRQANRGLAATRNRGIDETQSPYLIFLDADDRLTPNALRCFGAMFAQRPEVGLLYGPARHIDSGGRWLGTATDYANPGNMFDDLATGNRIAICSVAVRRSALADSRFDESLKSCEDWDLWLKLALRDCLWARVEEPVAELRFRAFSMSRNPEVMFASVQIVLNRVKQALSERPSAVSEHDIDQSIARSATHYAAMSAVMEQPRKGLAWMCSAGASDPYRLPAADAVSQALRGIAWYLCDGTPKERRKARNIVENMLAQLAELTGRADILEHWRARRREASRPRRIVNKLWRYLSRSALIIKTEK